MHLILRRNVTQEEFGIGFLGLHHCGCHERQEGVDDVITRQFDVCHLFGMIDAVARHLGTALIGSGKRSWELADERTFESASEDFGFVLHKDLHTSTLEGVDDTGTEIGNLFASVGVFGIGSVEGVLLLFGKEA